MPSIIYDVKDLGTVDDSHVMSQLAEQGYNPQSVSQDGQSVTLVDAQGPYTLTIPDALQKLGYEVQGTTVIPESAGFDTVSASLRAGVSKLPSDSMRKQYLEQSLQNKGIQNAQIVGQGRDWYFFDQSTGSYKALTNTPGWDQYDAVEAGMDIPRLVGAGLGGVGGALAGVGAGSIPLGMAGAAGGGALADIGTRYAMSKISPEFRQVAEENMGTMAKDVGINAAIDAVGFGAGRAIPAAAQAVFPALGQTVKNVMNKGVISPAVKTAGTVVEATGKGVASTAKAMQNTLGRSVTTMGIPGAGEAEILGELAQLPAAALRNAPTGMQKLGSTGFMNEYFPGAAGQLRQGGQNLRRAAETVTRRPLIDRAASAMSMGSEEAAARGASAPAVARVLGERGARSTGQILHTAGLRATPFNPGVVKSAGQYAEAAGRGAEHLANFGTGVASTARGVAGVGLAGVQAVGRGAQYAGGIMKTAGTLGSPLESRAVMQQGGDWLKDEAMQQLESLQRRRKAASMNSILAGN